jgi:hypothetical protein
MKPSKHPRALCTTALLLLFFVIPALAQKSKPAADFFPLRVGDSWTYRNSEGGADYTLKVLREEPQQGAATRYVIEMLAGVQVHSWFSKADGWVLMHGEKYPEHEGLEAKYEPPKRYLPDPLVPGAKWNWAGKDHTQTERSEKSHVEGFEQVTVVAGKFRALKVVSVVTGAATPMTKTSWYAEGVGLVKSTTDGGKIQYGSELVDYSFKKNREK